MGQNSRQRWSAHCYAETAHFIPALGLPDVRLRRVSLVASLLGEGRLTERTPAVPPWWREPYKMPQTGKPRPLPSDLKGQPQGRRLMAAWDHQYMGKSSPASFMRNAWSTS